MNTNEMSKIQLVEYCKSNNITIDKKTSKAAIISMIAQAEALQASDAQDVVETIASVSDVIEANAQEQAFNETVIEKLEHAQAEAEAKAIVSNALASTLFTSEATSQAISAAKQLREAKAKANAIKESKHNNTLITAIIKVRNKFTKTSIIEIALSVAAQSIDCVSCAQVASYIESEISEYAYYKHESNVTSRVRNHCIDAMQQLVNVDDNELITFSEQFLKIVRSDDHVKRITSLLAELKNSAS